MLTKLIRRWRASFAVRRDAINRAAVVAVNATVYRPTAWFDQAWQMLAANSRADVEALLAPDASAQHDPAERACLCAGLALMCGDPQQAQAHADSALAARADFSHACLQRARALRAQGRHHEALAAFQRVTELAPDDACAWTEQADECCALNEREDALDCYELALAHAPDCPAARLGLSRLLRESGDTAAALGHILHALKFAPDDAAIHFESALVHSRSGDTSASIAAYERTLELQPYNSAASVNLGLMYLSVRGDPLRAQRHFERAVELDPSSVAAQANLGLALMEQGRADAAIAHYEKLIAADPAEAEYRWNRGLALLDSGNYARGWDDYELRHARGKGAAPRNFPYPVWQGGALRPGAALLVYGEQGLGDEIMFASCVPDLHARGINVVLECDHRLAGLFARSFPYAQVHGAARDGDRSWLARYPQIEEQMAIGSLPRMLRRHADDFPPQGGFLHADPRRVAHWRESLARSSAGVNVGIAWSGGTAKTRRDLRSIPPRELAPLFEAPRVTFISLQREAGGALTEIAAICGANVLSFAGALNDVDETAALVQALDGVIAVDNTVAHLAGALGRKTWILLPHSADWRWLRARSTSPWYRSVKLHRQPAPGDWAAVIERVRAELKFSG
jgi:tetratricopeptide (TPR) repeat protein